nr:translocon-associated protein subunit alpha-like [Tanacetum cinerariifolium]
MAKIRVSSIFFTLLLLLSSSFLFQVARCQSDADDAELVAETVEEGNLGIVDDEVQDFGIGNYSPAPGVETVCVFPKNAAKTVVAGQETELLIGMKNEVLGLHMQN